jgi:hypothetical protein
MFDFMRDTLNYDSRKVGRFDGGNGLFISTARVSDGRQPYETAVRHPDYNEGSLVIVEAYDSMEEAKQGHDRWTDAMTREPLPDVLQDCRNAAISSFLDVEDVRFPRKASSTAPSEERSDTDSHPDG